MTAIFLTFSDRAGVSANFDMQIVYVGQKLEAWQLPEVARFLNLLHKLGWTWMVMK